MKNLPKKIYLQLGDDIAPEELKTLDFNDLDEVSWCAHKVHKSDIEYVVSDNAFTVASDNSVMGESAAHIINPFGDQTMFVAGLLKGKIRSVVKMDGGISSDPAHKYFDGLTMDDIRLYANVLTEEDCNELIKFLSIVRYCLPPKRRTFGK